LIELTTPASSADLEAYFDFRWRQLRAPWDMPRGSEKDELEELAIHIMARTESGEIVGVGRIHRTTDGDAQIRYMATKDTHRGLGIGRSIVERLEHLALESGASRIVINARENALAFYEKLGYKVFSDSPTLIGTIQHKWMSKRL
jgi:GNAT superfamily N-acetyltransferase